MKSFYKIIHTSCRTIWGNREKRILDESLWMKESGHQVAIVTPGAGDLFKKAKLNGFKVYPMSFKSLARIGEYGRLKQIFAGEQPFVVNAHGRKDAKLALKAAQTTGVPCRIMSRHNGERVKNTWPNKKIYKTRCHFVFTNSNDSLEHLKHTFSLSDMHIFSIPDGVALPARTNDKKLSRLKLANTLGLDTDARFIGIFGKTDAFDTDLAGKTAQKLSEQFPFHHLVVAAGQPQDREGMVETAASRVHIMPVTMADNDNFYKALDCGVYFSNDKNFYQGPPLQVIRAMACTCPVIGPDAPGVSDVLAEHETGRIFEPGTGNPTTLLNLIVWMIENPEQVQSLTQTARDLVEKRYTLDAMGRDIFRIYRLRQVKIDRQFNR